MKQKFVAIAAAVVGIGVGGLYAFDRWHAPSTTAVARSTTAFSPMGAYNDATVAVAPTAPTPSANREAPRSLPGPLHPGDAKFRQLASPQATYAERRKAYDMAATCMRENGPYGVKAIAKPCELSQGTWMDAETRKRLVTECAEAGDCWSEMFNEGPKGHYPVFSNAEYEPLEKRALAAALKKADPFAMRYEANALRDKAKTQQGDEARATLTQALTYEIASAANLAQLNGHEFVPSQDPNLQARLPLYAALTQAEADVAINKARELAAIFKKAKQTS